MLYYLPSCQISGERYTNKTDLLLVRVVLPLLPSLIQFTDYIPVLWNTQCSKFSLLNVLTNFHNFIIMLNWLNTTSSQDWHNQNLDGEKTLTSFCLLLFAALAQQQSLRSTYLR